MKKNNPKDIPYVLVQHNDSGKSFALSRGYRLMSANVPTTVKLWMINNQVQKDEPMSKGTKIKGTFKVKGHNERNDQKQTILQNKIENSEFIFA